MRKNKYGTYGTFSRSFSRVLAAVFAAAVAAWGLYLYTAPMQQARLLPEPKRNGRN